MITAAVAEVTRIAIDQRTRDAGEWQQPATGAKGIRGSAPRMGSEGWVRISTGGGVDWWHGSVGAWALCGRGLVPDRGIRRKVVEKLELVHDDVEASGGGRRLGAVPVFLEVAVDEDPAPVLEVLADGLGVLVEGGDGDMGPLFEEAPGPTGVRTAADDEDGEGGDDPCPGKWYGPLGRWRECREG